VVIGKVCLWELLNYFLSWSLSSLCGVNILAKFCAKSSDFSLLHLAQGPVIDVVHIGGEDSFGFLYVFKRLPY
jgi:hypothetical protein